jgi:SAM-dependent methyltransferase
VRFVDFPQEVHPERLLAVSYIQNITLDIGCGGRKTAPEVIGVDILPLTDICCSGDCLPCKDNSIDTILSRHSFEHIINPIKTLREWLRVLKPEGSILIIMPDHEKVDTMDTFYSHNLHMHAYTQQSFGDLVSLLPIGVVQNGVAVEGWSFFFVLKKPVSD